MITKKPKIKNYFVKKSMDYVPDNFIEISKESFEHTYKKLIKLMDSCYGPTLGNGSRYITRGCSLGFYFEGGIASIDQRRGEGDRIYLMNESLSGIEKMASSLGLVSEDSVSQYQKEIKS